MARSIVHTEICDMLGIEYPVICAGMGVVAGPALAAAVSNAGGLGVMGVINLEPEQTRDWIRQVKTLTDKPFGVNTVFPAGLPPEGTVIDLRAMIPEEVVLFADKLAAEWRIPKPKNIRPQLLLTSDKIKKQVEIILEEKVPVLASGMGDPAAFIPDAHSAGTKVISVCGNSTQARRLAEGGSDIIVAQGFDAGGHAGKIGTMALIPEVVDAVSPIPVVAAGGIGDGRGLAAALALGAKGVWAGTAFCATNEAGIESVEMGHMGAGELQFWKEQLIKAKGEDVVLTRVLTGKSMHVVKNKFIDMWEKQGPACLPLPLQTVAIDELTQGIREAGITELTCATIGGQGVGLASEIVPAHRVIDGMVSMAEDVLGKLTNQHHGH